MIVTANENRSRVSIETPHYLGVEAHHAQFRPGQQRIPRFLVTFVREIEEKSDQGGITVLRVPVQLTCSRLGSALPDVQVPSKESCFVNTNRKRPVQVELVCFQ